MRKQGGTPSWRDKHFTLAAISPPAVARGRFIGGQQSGLAGCKPPPLFTRRASSCLSQGRRQGEPRGASRRPSAPTYLPPHGTAQPGGGSPADSPPARAPHGIPQPNTRHKPHTRAPTPTPAPPSRKLPTAPLTTGGSSPASSPPNPCSTRQHPIPGAAVPPTHPQPVLHTAHPSPTHRKRTHARAHTHTTTSHSQATHSTLYHRGRQSCRLTCTPCSTRHTPPRGRQSRRLTPSTCSTRHTPQPPTHKHQNK